MENKIEYEKTLFTYKIIKEPTGVTYGSSSLSNPGAVVEFMEEYYRDYFAEDKEAFSVLLLNTKNKVIGIKTISIGTLDCSIVHPREVFKAAILNSAKSIMVFHNHPSGDTDPSSEDISITKRLAEAGGLLGIKILDHIILGNNGNYLSMLEERLIPKH